MSSALEISSFFRAVNEQIVELSASLLPLDHLDLICECEDAGCTVAMRMTLAEYEAMRAEPDLHAVVPSHDGGGFDTVVGRTDRYVVLSAASAEAAPEQAT